MMDVRYPKAEWRPLGTNNEPRIGRPRVLIFHTMVGFLSGTDTMFREKGYNGTESHFGVGGIHDGINDGIVWQWQSIDYQADAQFSGNAYATSVETSDGGHPKERWSEKQAAALVDLAVWWCRTTGNPARLVTSPNDKGFGYHQQFPEWNLNNHDCPGSVRVSQLINEIIPRVRTVLNGSTDVSVIPTAKENAEALIHQGYNARGNTVGYALQTMADGTGAILASLGSIDARLTSNLGSIDARLTAIHGLLIQIRDKLDPPTDPQS